MLVSLFAELLHQRDVALLRSAIPEFTVVEGVRKIARIFLADLGPGLLCEQLRYLGIGALAVEHLYEFPLLRREPIEVGCAAHVGDNDWLAFLRLKSPNKVWVHPRQALDARLIDGKCGEGRIEGFRQIHG